MTFVTWIQEELDKKNWKRSDLARASGLADTTITLVYNGDRQPGLEFCVKIAKAFDISEITVLRKAGLIPDVPDKDGRWEDLRHLLYQLPAEEWDDFFALAQIRLEKNKTKGGKVDVVREATTPRKID